MYAHQAVLVREVIKCLKPQPNQNFIDGTVGGGGHADEILKKTGPNGKLLGLDLDPEAIKAATKRLKKYRGRVLLIKTNYKNLKQIYYENRIFTQCHGFLLDLGLSSHQLADEDRGFSFQSQGEILMNYGDDYQILAKDILNEYTQEELKKIFKEYGDEKFAHLIAQQIIIARQKQKQNLTAAGLSGLILQVYKNKTKSKIHPATKVFQALRIAVNDEINNLKETLPQALKIITSRGRIAVISFHSLEDKVVKNFFRQEARDCLCPVDLPVCRCGHKQSLKIITKKPIIATPQEVAQNPRSRSAKFRVAEKI